MSDSVGVGVAGPEHEPFVFDAWRIGAREYARRTERPWDAAAHKEVTEDVVHTGVIRVATVNGVFAGFIAARPSDGHVYYVYVKKPFRGFGIARKLYEHVNPKREPWTTFSGGFAVNDELRDRYRVRLLS